MTANLKTYDNREDFVFAAVQAMHTACAGAVGQRGIFTVAVPGGTTPKPLFEALAQSPGEMDWERTHVFFTDERCVDPADSRSNYFNADSLCLSRVGVSEYNVHRIPGEKGAGEAVREAEADTRAFFGGDGMPALDLVVLGMGPDGHVASLFPGSQALEADGSLYVAEEEPGRDPRVPRVSMSMPFILAARKVVVLVRRKGKEKMVDAVMRGELDRSVPAARVAPSATVEWLVRAD
ncbi:6-phosphogluconolactonase [Desulfohalovibrio reitneri]|uniref:6-phosphogluconolactonase n=1 Tax=Desulfohalovibrio reitneri TaxID=1307759 RepID=UPI0005526A8F|nr:6-phosphogluconolactonase [Desulfohalovibrio reitneri]